VTIDEHNESAFERAASLLAFAAFWAAFAMLATGLVLWLALATKTTGHTLLVAGLMGLLAMPIVKLTTIVAAAIRQRDGLTLAATLAVLAILFALTLRDAAG
jgi:hypothetical protein